MKLEAAIAEEVQALADLDLQGLRDRWRARFGPPPKVRSADLLRRNLAWRIQAAAYGGLEKRTLAALRSRYDGDLAVLAPGVRLTREWLGVKHEVEVQVAGFLYKGRPYRSLSQVARQITGVRWNGPRFFGLRPSMARADG